MEPRPCSGRRPWTSSAVRGHGALEVQTVQYYVEALLTDARRADRAVVGAPSAMEEVGLSMDISGRCLRTCVQRSAHL